MPNIYDSNFASPTMTTPPTDAAQGMFGLSANKSSGNKSNLGMNAASGAAMAGIGLATGGTGWLVSGLITLGGSILGAFTKRQRALTPEEQYFKNLQDLYYRAGQRQKLQNTVRNLIVKKK